MVENNEGRYQLHAANLEKARVLFGRRGNPYEIDDILGSIGPERMATMLTDLESKLTNAGDDEATKHKITDQWLESAKITVRESIKERNDDRPPPINAEGGQETNKSSELEEIDERRQRVTAEIEEYVKLSGAIIKERATLNKAVAELEQKENNLTPGERERLKLFKIKVEELRKKLGDAHSEEEYLRDRLENLDENRRKVEEGATP